MDALRGLAIGLVVLYHLGTAGGPIGWHPAAAVPLGAFRFGFSGVHLFLVLSGFCLTHSLIRRDRAGRPQSLPRYLRDRWFRIAPPYYVAMFLYLLLPLGALLLTGHAGSQGGVLTGRQIFTHLLFLHGFWADTIDAINVPFWSLALEFQFYLTLPLLFLLATRVGPWPVVAGVVAVNLAFRAWVLYETTGLDHLLNGCFAGRWGEFALGMGVAFWFDRGARRAWLCGLAALPFLSLAAWLTTLGDRVAADLTFGLGYASLLAAVVGAERPGRVATCGPLAGLGAISYSVYLTHSLVLERGVQVYRRVLRHPGAVSDVLVVVAVLGLVVAGGWLFFRLVERRFVRSVARERA